LSYPGPPENRTRHLAVQSIGGRHQLIPAARHVQHPQTNPDVAHRRGRPWLEPRSEPLTCERSPSSADSCAPELAGNIVQHRRDPFGSLVASHSCTSARMYRPSSKKSSKRLGT